MTASQPIRLLVATAVVGIYMALGWVLRLDPNAYLLLGIPLLLAFQIFVARRPVTELWLRNPPARFLTWPALLAAVPFMICPVWSAVHDGQAATWPVRLWYAAAVAGTLPLGATLVNATRRTWLALLGCLLTAGSLYVVLVAVTVAAHHWIGHKPWFVRPEPLLIAGKWFLLYLPICFAVEEVFFRGGIDSYVQREGDRFGWLTAIFVSCLWGWWHMPIFGYAGAGLILVLSVLLPPMMCLPGIPFSIFWRRGGSLLVTATVHALLDAIRNALL